MRFFKRKGKVHKIDNDYQSGKVVYGNVRGGAYHTPEEARKINEQRYGHGHSKKNHETLDQMEKRLGITSYKQDHVYDDGRGNRTVVKDERTPALPDPQLLKLQQMGQKSIRTEPHLEKDFFIKDIDHVDNTRWGENKDIYPSNFNRVVREGDLPHDSPYRTRQL